MTASTDSISTLAIPINTVANEDIATNAVWPLILRIAFRFVFVYFGTYVLTTQMLAGMVNIPFLTFSIPELGKVWPARELVMWVGHHILHVTPILAPTGSGDTMYDWTHAFALLVLTIIITALWSLVDRQRQNYARLHKWFRLFLRIALGTTMLGYGFAKFFPLQMPTVFLPRLLEPYGNFSPMGVLWYSIGAAPVYERFLGFAEILAGALLFLPRTTLLGALMCFNLSVGVFMVNMTYDVPVKLFSFHLIVLSLVLLAPEGARLIKLFVLNHTVPRALSPTFGSTIRSHRIWVGLQAVYLVWMLGSGLQQGSKNMKEFGADAPKSPLFGIWAIDSMARDGVELLPLTTDSTRFRYAVFQRPANMTFQKQDLTFTSYATTIDTLKRTIELKPPGNSTEKATLTYQRPAPDQLLLDGDIQNKRVHMRLKSVDLSTLNINRGFHWVQEQPFNR